VAEMMLTLEGRHFRRNYLLYIIEITHGNDKHFYIGQTGDHKYVTARPAYRRLAGHLSDVGKSTENQVYRYLVEKVIGFKEAIGNKNKFSDEVKKAVEDYLVNSTVKMYIYPLQDFKPGIDQANHLQNVRKVTLFEKMVTKLFVGNSIEIANKKITKPKLGVECPYPMVLDEIVSDFNLKQ